ncbi:MAG: glycosyltransferase family 2 protein [Clostridiales Family XIII bacterium]|jgi:glycosyltransferase involved in cell wall biosynthesis|nr:glycosyltransferase family 2 protein [Clostridiales Family XIII bacterium]
MSDRILFFTCAYNAEKTLRIALDSIMGQTHGNWVYYVLDNGSTDSTGDIIREYENRDGRIHGLSAEKNDILNLFHTPFRKNGLLPDVDYGWLAILDSDDAYAPGFAEKSLSYAHENGLDLVVVSSDRISRGPKKDRIFASPEDYEDFPSWYKIWLPAWAKLYCRSVTERMRKCRIGYFDGGVAMEAITQCSKMGFLAETLHRARPGVVDGDSTAVPSDQEVFDWIAALPQETLQVGRTFFKEKCGRITKRSEDILFYVAGLLIYQAIKRFDNSSSFDTLRHGKLAYIKSVWASDFMKEFVDRRDFGYEMQDPEILQESRANVLRAMALELIGKSRFYESANDTVLRFYAELIQGSLAAGGEKPHE